jgi:hypothetical protein
VPQSYREAALALGVARWKVIMVIVVRTALKGIATGVIVALARIAGETAPLLFTALGNNFWNHNLKEPIAALPLQIFAYAISPYDDWHRQAWAGALVLMALILALNITVRVLSRDRNRDPLNAMSTLPEAAKARHRANPTSATPAGRRRPRPAGPERRRSPSTSRTSACGTASARRSRTSRSSIPAKKVTAIIGPSGCGKSTFLRALNRMHELTPGTRLEGSLRHFGRRPLRPGRRGRGHPPRVGMVFQKSNPFPTMSIAENVLVGLRLNGVATRPSCRSASRSRCTWRPSGTR